MLEPYIRYTRILDKIYKKDGFNISIFKKDITEYIITPYRIVMDLRNNLSKCGVVGISDIVIPDKSDFTIYYKDLRNVYKECKEVKTSSGIPIGVVKCIVTDNNIKFYIENKLIYGCVSNISYNCTIYIPYGLLEYTTILNLNGNTKVVSVNLLDKMIIFKSKDMLYGVVTCKEVM